MSSKESKRSNTWKDIFTKVTEFSMVVGVEPDPSPRAQGSSTAHNFTVQCLLTRQRPSGLTRLFSAVLLFCGWSRPTLSLVGERPAFHPDGTATRKGPSADSHGTGSVREKQASLTLSRFGLCLLLQHDVANAQLMQLKSLSVTTIY